MRRSYRPRTTSSKRALVIVLVVIALIVGCCGTILFMVGRDGRTNVPAKISGDISMTIAYSPDKEQTFAQLVKAFNDGKPRLPDGKRVQVVATAVSIDEMAQAALTGAYQAISPDSSIWLADIDREWSKAKGAEATLVGETTRYMVSPVVIAMWTDVAKSLGYPGRELGWQDVLKAAVDKPEFKWSHSSTNTASGLLATLALFYAGSGLQRGLTEQAATAPATLDYVSRLEKTVKHYGEGETAIIQQVEREGRAFLDAFVMQEQTMLAYNLRKGAQLVAIYPSEGSLWADHPLALLEHPNLTNDQRLAYSRFKQYLLSRDAQALILRQGYRPTDLTILLDQADSPLKIANGVDPTRPYTTLQVPSPSVISVVKNVWLYTKRHANIYLIADVSGSMAGRKLEDAKAALKVFGGQIQGDMERVGLIAFSSSVAEVVPLMQLGQGRARLNEAVAGLQAGGNTALLDAVQLALTKLQDLRDKERINAIVVMTDGKENQSRTSLRTLQDRLRNKGDLPVVVFCIAYGSDADMAMLESIASASGGLARRGDMETIKQLYKTMSTYF